MYDPQPNDATLVELTPKRAQLFANGSDTDTIRIEIPINTDPIKRKVVLKTSLGKFIDSDSQSIEVSVDQTDSRFPDKRVKFVALKSGLQTGNAIITASLQGNEANTKIEFMFDSATVVTVEADRFFLASLAEANIKASVSKTKSRAGKPTAGQKVYFTASTDSMGRNTKGYFRAVSAVTDETSTATAIYACDSTYKGEIFIIAKIVKGHRDTAFAKFKIFKTKP